MGHAPERRLRGRPAGTDGGAVQVPRRAVRYPRLVAGDRLGGDRRVRRRSRPSGRGHRDRQPAAPDRGLARRRELAGRPPLRRPRHPGPGLAAAGPAALVHPVGLRSGRPAGLTPGPEVTGSATQRTATDWRRTAPWWETREAPA